MAKRNLRKGAPKNDDTSLVTVGNLRRFKVKEDAVIDAKVAEVNDKISTAATQENPALDRESVIQLIATSAGEFKGSFDNWAAVPTDPTQYVGGTAPKKGDQMIVQDASDYEPIGKEETWMFKYVGTWSTDGKDGWAQQYKISSQTFTPEQMAAINSGITSELVAKYNNYETVINEHSSSITTLNEAVEDLNDAVDDLETTKQDNITVDETYLSFENNKVALKNLATESDIDSIFD